MNKILKKQWIKALRSGEYIKGIDKLCQINKKEEEAFCSMGVLADIGLDTYWISEEPYEDIRIGGSLLMLNHSQLVLLGINDTIQRRITCLNDRYRWSFNRIADWIEKHL